jgi:hypothetical protein
VGSIIRSTNGKTLFRVYQSDGEFDDYDISHSDMLVKIVDDDASFYEFADGSQSVDHTPETLGIASSVGQVLQ